MRLSTRTPRTSSPHGVRPEMAGTLPSRCLSGSLCGLPISRRRVRTVAPTSARPRNPRCGLPLVVAAIATLASRQAFSTPRSSIGGATEAAALASRRTPPRGFPFRSLIFRSRSSGQSSAAIDQRRSPARTSRRALLCSSQHGSCGSLRASRTGSISKRGPRSNRERPEFVIQARFWGARNR